MASADESCERARQGRKQGKSTMKRYARRYVLLHPTDCDPPHGLDMSPGGRDDLKVRRLEQSFAESGFDPDEPALIGYPLNGRIQLLSGTHRHSAALRANIMLPVVLTLSSVVQAAWSTPDWEHVIADVPVKNLELVEVEAVSLPPGIDERVDLSRDLY